MDTGVANPGGMDTGGTDTGVDGQRGQRRQVRWEKWFKNHDTVAGGSAFLCCHSSVLPLVEETRNKKCTGQRTKHGITQFWRHLLRNA